MSKQKQEAKLRREKAALEAQLRRETAYDACDQAMKHWPAPEVIETKRPVGQYNLTYTENKLPVVETVMLFAQVVSCGHPGNMRMILTNSFGDLVFTVRFAQTAVGYEAAGYYQKTGLRTMNLPTHFRDVEVFTNCFLNRLRKETPADVVHEIEQQPELFEMAG